jgi:probable phosphoglycerate mutase
MSAGYVVRAVDGGVRMSHVDLATGTNNIAEYEGLIAGLRAADMMGVTHLEVRGDSQVVIYRMSGRYKKPPAPHLVPLIREALELAARFDSCTFRWVPREQNWEADLAAEPDGEKR